jgi:hypothetical protein
VDGYGVPSVPDISTRTAAARALGFRTAARREYQTTGNQPALRVSHGCTT